MIDGGLFTRDFLIEGIRATAAWQALDDQSVEELRARTKATLDSLAARRNPNEAQTEDDLVYPLLEAVGWHYRDVQPNASVKARLDVPDALLFSDEAAKTAAGVLEPWRRFAHGLCVVEAKRWGRALDREERGRKGEEGTPSSQMLRYLRRVDDITKGDLRWGILTNGRVWRLYFQGALSVAEDFFEIDLGKVLAVEGCDFDLLDRRPAVFGDDRQWRDHILRLFVVVFGRDSFLPDDQSETFHQLALREGKRWEARVARNLSDTVFETIFPGLAQGLAAVDTACPQAPDAAYLSELREGALILLYRLLFVLYAEDRNLLPDENGPYAPYCLTRIRQEVAARAGQPYPKGVVTLWPRLTTIFRAISEGNDDLGIPAYNGGLFDPEAAPILNRVQLPDVVLAQVIFGLSHQPDAGDGRGPKYINYRDLSVQQLGSVYEGILEFGLRLTPDGRVEPDADDEARHRSGSYYTPDELVALIIERAVGPLVDERIESFRAAAIALANDRRPVAARLEELAALDPAVAILSLRIIDPAMGSGHFLVSLVDWLSDSVLDAIEDAKAVVTWGEYASPLAARIAGLRARILTEAKSRRWPIVEAQLDDRHVARRMVLKRVVYGVDKNPMAVELAKVALWLHSFTVGAPLSFLDHHLRAGDSVMGAWVGPTVDALRERGALFNLGQIARVEQVSGLMAEIEETTDNDIAEVASSKEKFKTVAEATEPVAGLFSLIAAESMMGIFDAAPKSAPDLRKLTGKPEKQHEKARRDLIAFERAAALQLVLEGTFGDPIRIASGVERIAPPELKRQLSLLPVDAPDQSSMFPAISIDDRRRVTADALVDEARGLADRHGFLHWEIAFPGVWSNLASAQPTGGFDAVIGNPPYVRQELLGPEVKRALKRGYKAFNGMADLYVYFYEQGLRLLKPGGRMSYVVTNKWLKAGYAEELRRLFSDDAWLEFIADFGHAKHFFPDADVFPSVVTVRKPLRGLPPPEEAAICVIPRDSVPRRGLETAVTEATFPLPRAMFTREAWVLEPRPVMDLLDKIRRNGVPLAEYAGVKPYRGVLTGLNEAFLIDTAKRHELVRADPSCAEIIKPYLRGQDIERWHSPDSGLFMIVLKSSGNHPWPWASESDEKQAEAIFARTYPSLHRHMKAFEAEWRDGKGTKRTGLRARQDQGRFWWELRSCDYYEAFDRPKIVYQAIQFAPRYAVERRGLYGNNKTYFLTSDSTAVAAALNSPLLWWVSWRRFLHMKDEALSNDAVKLIDLPMPADRSLAEIKTEQPVQETVSAKRSIVSADLTILDWLRHEFGLERLGHTLAQPHLLDADGFVAALRKALPKSRRLSAADVARLKQEHATTLGPARVAADDTLALERRLSDLVNAAYCLTPEEVQLMWDTAPPRMPSIR